MSRSRYRKPRKVRRTLAKSTQLLDGAAHGVHHGSAVGVASAPLAVMANPIVDEGVYVVRQLLEGRGTVSAARHISGDGSRGRDGE